jgi:hypothetical protein
MQVYVINTSDLDVLHVVARTSGEAADLFVTWSIAGGRDPESFTVEALSVHELPVHQQEQVQQAIAAGLLGIAHFDQELGWTFSPPLWPPLAGGEASSKHQDRPPRAVRLFEFRDTSEISAVVLAENYDDATEIFEEYVLSEGGDPDSLLWREIAIGNLQDEASSAVSDAMNLNREGLVICQAEDRWVFIAPLDHRGSPEPS